MSKVKAISQEELDFLEAERAKKQKNTSLKMKQLAINSDSVDDDGKPIPADTWYIRGDSTFVNTVSFRPLRYKQKFIRMSQEGKKWTTDNESIFVEGFEPAYDISGGKACGRIIGKLPEHWTEEQKTANYKKATIYGFLFGLVTVPGQPSVLVNFRAAPAKATVIREAFKALGGAEMYNYDFEMKLTPKKGEYVTFTMTPNLNNKHESIADIIPSIKEVDAFIESHNDFIMKRRATLIDSLKGGIDATATYKEVSSLASDFDDLEDPEFMQKAKKGIAL